MMVLRRQILDSVDSAEVATAVDAVRKELHPDFLFKYEVRVGMFVQYIATADFTRVREAFKGTVVRFGEAEIINYRKAPTNKIF